MITVHDDQGLRLAKRYVGKAEVEDYLREISEKELKLSLSVLTKLESNTTPLFRQVMWQKPSRT